MQCSCADRGRTAFDRRVLTGGKVAGDAGYPGVLLSLPHLIHVLGMQLGHHSEQAATMDRLCSGVADNTDDEVSANRKGTNSFPST